MNLELLAILNILKILAIVFFIDHIVVGRKKEISRVIIKTVQLFTIAEFVHKILNEFLMHPPAGNGSCN